MGLQWTEEQSLAVSATWAIRTTSPRAPGLLPIHATPIPLRLAAKLKIWRLSPHHGKGRAKISGEMAFYWRSNDYFLLTILNCTNVEAIVDGWVRETSAAQRFRTVGGQAEASVLGLAFCLGLVSSWPRRSRK